MKQKLKKRNTRKLNAAFNESKLVDSLLANFGIRKAYVSGINSKPLMPKEEARKLMLKGYRGLMRCSPIIYWSDDE